MRTFKQHLPNYFDDSFKRKTIKFESIEELLKNPIFNCWKEGDGKEKDVTYTVLTPKKGTLVESKEIRKQYTPKFYRFSLSDHHLMCEMDEGTKWYVLGSIDNINDLDLPTWKPIYREKT